MAILAQLIVQPRIAKALADIHDTDDSSTDNTISAQDANAKSPLTSFTLFPKLPMELRLVIWEMILPGQRFVDIRSTLAYVEGYEGRVDEAGMPYEDYTIRTWHPVGVERAPVGFFICRESRIEILKTYTSLKSTDGNPAVFVDFTKDVLCFRYWRFHASIEEFLNDQPNHRLAHNLAYLLTDEDANDTFGAMPGYHSFLMHSRIADLRGLKEVLLVANCRREASCRMITGFKECGVISPQAKQSCQGIKETFDAIEKSNPNLKWKRPKARYGRALLGEIQEV